jgi:hypothetical protein
MRCLGRASADLGRFCFVVPAHRLRRLRCATMVRKAFQCTDCGSLKGYHSHLRNAIEKYILPVLGLRPVRCADCYRRSYEPFFVIVREHSESEVRRRSAA